MLSNKAHLKWRLLLDLSKPQALCVSPPSLPNNPKRVYDGEGVEFPLKDSARPKVQLLKNII